MKRRLVTLLAFILLSGCLSMVAAQSRATSAFEHLKLLVGEWDSEEAGTSNAKVTYQLVSGGSVLMETRMPKNEPEMVTLFHLDNDKLLATHYCSIGNQPRLVAEFSAGESRTIIFNFLDVTNLKKPTDGYMRGLRYEFVDKNNTSQTWTYREGDKDIASTFKLKRIK